MDQQRLAKHVVDNLFRVPEKPARGRFISVEEADRIVSATIDHVGRCGDPVELKYLNAHRRRLAASLAMIPIAESADSSFLDIGCYGYMTFWASEHLGYSKVEGVELRPDATDAISRRSSTLDGKTVSAVIHNFDIANEHWPLEGTYDTIVMLETLEHVNVDPAGVLVNISKRMRSSSAFIISVPNALSYITLREFITGAPPWNYWFFHPDLSHEPRHCFEYPPIFFKILLQAVGFEELAFRTIFAFSDPADLGDMFEIGKALSIDPRLFGDTLIAQLRKTSDIAPVRYPDCIYNGERYYESTYPILEPLRRQAISRILEQLHNVEGRATAAEALRRVDEAVEQAREADARTGDALNRYVQKELALQSSLATEKARADDFQAALATEKARADDLQVALAGERARADDLESRLATMLTSATWRGTEPIRKLFQRFSRLRDSIERKG